MDHTILVQETDGDPDGNAHDQGDEEVPGLDEAEQAEEGDADRCRKGCQASGNGAPVTGDGRKYRHEKQDEQRGDNQIDHLDGHVQQVSLDITHQEGGPQHRHAYDG